MADEQEVKEAEKAESADDKEDKDYKNQEEPGHQSDEGYIEDDASKAEQADTTEDEDYQGALDALDQRYAKAEDVANLMGRMDKLEAQFGAGNKPTNPEEGKEAPKDDGITYISKDGSQI